MKKLYKFDFSKYTYIYDEGALTILRGEEDITNQTYNNPLRDLMIAYDNLKEEYDKLNEQLNNNTKGHWIEKIIRGSLGLVCSECGCQHDTICESLYCQNCGSEMDVKATEKLSEDLWK